MEIGHHHYKRNSELTTVRNYRKIPYVQEQENLYITALKDPKFKTKVDDENACQCNTSGKFREIGDELYSRTDSDRDLLGACLYYTKAILAARSNIEENLNLSLSYANRSAALLEFGYYAQAYNDCVTALEYENPEQTKNELILRQAQCTLYLCDLKLVEHILNPLKSENLDARQIFILQNIKYEYQRQLTLENKTDFKKLTEEPEEMPLQQTNTISKIKIIENKGVEKLSVIATQDIQKGEEIVNEPLYCFASLPDIFICHACGTTQLIPIFCKQCVGSYVMYCSFECRDAHGKIHKYECLGFCLEIFSNQSLEDTDNLLAFRFLLTGILETYPFLRAKRNANAIWNELMNKNSQLGSNENIQFTKYLRIPVDGFPIGKNIVDMIIRVQDVINYLKFKTQFFEQMKGSNASMDDWHLVLSALLLRLIILSMEKGKTLNSNGKLEQGHCHMFDKNLWQQPYRLKIGRLYKYSQPSPVMKSIFWTHHVMRLSCYGSIERQFTNNENQYFSKYFIKKGDEIFTSLINMSGEPISYKYRQAYYRNTLKRKCTCVECNKPNPDEINESLLKFKCEVPNCEQEFILDNFNLEMITEMMSPNCRNRQFFNCPSCKSVQKYEWFENYINTTIDKPDFASSILKATEISHNYLLGNNYLKTLMFENTLMYPNDFENILKNIHPDDNDKLANVILYIMENGSVQPLNCFYRMSFLWDLIALGKYKCSKPKIKELLKLLNYLPKEERKIFKNYYRDYLQDYFKFF